MLSAFTGSSAGPTSRSCKVSIAGPNNKTPRLVEGDVEETPLLNFLFFFVSFLVIFTCSFFLNFLLFLFESLFESFHLLEFSYFFLLFLFESLFESFHLLEFSYFFVILVWCLFYFFARIFLFFVILV
jgi:hypothetical protein